MPDHSPTALPRITPQRLTGSERFHGTRTPQPFDVQEFWQWSVSDLVSNATRGRLAEFIVAKALDIPTDGVRDEWAAYDLITPDEIKVEVKSAAYLQAWAQSKPSAISFSVRKARAWDPDSNAMAAEPDRHADVYVFALLAHAEKTTLDPLDLNQWEFFLLSAQALNARQRSQHSISLASLRNLQAGPVSFRDLKAGVSRALGSGGA